jgi:F-type H+-transporting ATPase subunit a
VTHGEGGHEEQRGVFDPHQGTWLNPIIRGVLRLPKPEMVEHEGETHASPVESVRYDFLFLALLLMTLIAVIGYLAGKQVKLRPEGKPTSIANFAEAAAEGYQNYLIGIMGRDLALKYTPLIATFFFTILFFNYAGLIPGLMSPTTNPNVPFGLAFVAFVATHVIAIREAGVKSWIMHFVGEPLWLAPLLLPLHIIGELIKPVSLAVRLLGNLFGEETVVAKLAGLSLLLMATLHVPIPLQFPMMALGVFFGGLQALVFSTLLAIYISILSTHHDDHDEHNVHGHVEHVRLHGHDEVIAHPSEATIAMKAHPAEAPAVA